MDYLDRLTQVLTWLSVLALGWLLWTLYRTFAP